MKLVYTKKYNMSILIGINFMDNSFLNRLKEVRKSFGISGYDFAKKLDIKQPTYFRYETGEQKPSALLIEKLVTLCNINALWLFTGRGGMFMEIEEEAYLKPDYNLGVQFDFDEWGKRLLMLQVNSGMLDSEAFAKYVDISPKRLDDFIRKNKYPTGEELLKLKIRFSKTDFDWLLFGKK